MLTAQDIVSVFAAQKIGAGMANVQSIITDDAYASPTRDWVTTTFAKALKDDLVKLGASAYQPSRNDCDKFALYSMALARLMNNLSTDKEASLTFGMIGYTRAVFPPVCHSINIVIVENREVMFFEPQLQAEVQLLPEEVDSIFFYLI